MKRVTTADIAAASGFSRTTVSLALNNHPRVSPVTKERIREVAASMGFPGWRPALPANLLVIVPEGAADRGDLCTCYLSGMAQTADAMGANCVPLTYSDSATSLWVLDHHLRSASSSNTAVIVAGRHDRRMQLVEKAQAAGHPVVVLFGEERPDISIIRVNEVASAEKAVRFLADRGIGGLTFLGDTRSAPYMAQRQKGALATAAALGIESTVWTVTEGAQKRAQESLPGQPRHGDAILAGSPSLALFCLARLQEAGVRVPEDVQLMTFDHSPRVESTSIFITSVGFTPRLAGKLAAETALKILDCQIERCIVDMPTHIVERKSTRRVR